MFTPVFSFVVTPKNYCTIIAELYLVASRLLGGDFVGGEMTVNPTSESLLIDFVSFFFLQVDSGCTKHARSLGFIKPQILLISHLESCSL